MAEDNQVPIFLTVIGGKAYAVLLVAPDLPEDNKAYDALVGFLKNHYEPKPVVIAERFHFHKRSQALEESVVQFLAALRRLATHCKLMKHFEII